MDGFILKMNYKKILENIDENAIYFPDNMKMYENSILVSIRRDLKEVSNFIGSDKIKHNLFDIFFLMANTTSLYQQVYDEVDIFSTDIFPKNSISVPFILMLSMTFFNDVVSYILYLFNYVFKDKLYVCRIDNGDLFLIHCDSLNFSAILDTVSPKIYLNSSFEFAQLNYKDFSKYIELLYLDISQRYDYKQKFYNSKSLSQSISFLNEILNNVSTPIILTKYF